MNVDLPLQYINYLKNYHVCPRCIVLLLLPKRTCCFLLSSACSLLQHLGVYLDERNYNCISNKQHQNKIHNPQRQSNAIIYFNFSFWNDLKKVSWAQMFPLCEMLWSCKCFINWQKACILWEINMAIILMLISFIGEWSLTTQEITSDLPQVNVKPVQVRLYRVHLVIDGNWTRDFSNTLTA